MATAPTLDELVQSSADARRWIAGLEQAERERTGIKGLKVGFNKVFGYYIEVTHANARQVPAHYIRKQTLKNAERYITPELKEYEEKRPARPGEDRRAGDRALRPAAGDRPSATRLLARPGPLPAWTCSPAGRGGRAPPLSGPSWTTARRSRSRRAATRSWSDQTAAAGAFVPNDCRLDTATAEQIA